MNYLVYHKIQDPVIKHGMINTIRRVSEQIHHTPHLVSALNSIIFDRIPQDLILYIEEYLLDKTLHKDDEIYVCYTFTEQFRIWRIKKKGRLKIRKWVEPAYMIG